MKNVVSILQRAVLLFVVVLITFTVSLMFIIKNSAPPATSNSTVQVVSENERIAFFDRIKLIAQQNQRDYGVLASITMAQAALESNYGKSGLAANYFNLFGIKGTEQNGVLLPTLEFIDGKYVEIKDYFVVYQSWDQSIIEHGKLLYYGTPWNANQYRDVIVAKNYHDAALGLVTGGYATDPNYATKIVQMIELYKLYEYDK